MAGRRQQRQKRKRKSKGGVIAISLVVMMLSAVIAYKSVELKAKNEAYIAREQSLEAQIASEEERKAELEEYEKYVQTKKYVEEVAREKLGLVHENEIIFKPEN